LFSFFFFFLPPPNRPCDKPANDRAYEKEVSLCLCGSKKRCRTRNALFLPITGPRQNMR
jgi:hypothetical protein